MENVFFLWFAMVVGNKQLAVVWDSTVRSAVWILHVLTTQQTERLWEKGGNRHLLASV